MERPSAEERQAFVDFAEHLALGCGLRLLRVLEMLAVLPWASEPAARGSTVDARVPRESVAGGSGHAPLRLVLLGESAAAGYLLAPDLTPAAALREVLVIHSSQASYAVAPWEVVDLAAVDLSGSDLLATARRAAELRPDVVVVFAGNNWPVRLRLSPPPGHLGPVEQALAFRAAGTAGLRRLADEATQRVARQTISGVLRVVRASGALPVVVVPEVDLLGWSRARPVPWLPGDGVARWHEAHADAIRCLLSGDPTGALVAAEGLLALDGGDCPTTHRLRATALLALSRRTEAREAARAEVDARAWDNDPTVPGATSTVHDALRTVAADDGALLVDLPVLFEAEPDVPPLFLDYCHLSPRGVAVTVAALAERILTHLGLAREATGIRSSAERVCRLSPSAEARALFLSGLYTAHWSEPAGGGADPARARLTAALAVDPSLASAFYDWVATRVVPRDATLFSLPMQRLGEGLLAGLDPLWNVPGLDPDGLDRLTAVGGADLARALLCGLIGSTHDACQGAVDLLDPAYLWGAPSERAARRFFGSGTHAFRRVFWPHLDVALVVDGQRPVTLDLTFRRPCLRGTDGEPIHSVGDGEIGSAGERGEGEIQILVNGRPATSIRVGASWQRKSVTLPVTALEPGLNRLRLVFPPPAERADAALAQIGEDLDLGIGALIHPCFGEVFRLVARPATER